MKTFAAAISTSWWATKDSLRNYRLLSVSAWISCLLMMAVPSLQVWAVRWAGPIIGGSQPDRVLLACVVVSATVGLLGLGSNIYGNITRMLQMRLRTRYGAEFSMKMAHLTTAQTNDATFMGQVRAVRESIPFNVAWQSTSTITVVSALFSMVLLAASLWAMSPWVAILVALALVPDLFAYSQVANTENAMWQQASGVGRRIDYLEQLQDFTPSAVELAASSGKFGIPEELNRAHAKFGDLWNKVPRVSMRYSGLVTVIVLFLAVCAIRILVESNAGVEGVAATLLGIISGLSVTRSVGAAVGELMASAPMILEYRRLLTTVGQQKASLGLHQPVGVHLNNVSVTYQNSASAETQEPNEPASEPVMSGASSQTLVAVNSVTVHIVPGSLVALVGQNGSGKTSLAKLVAGLVPPASGSVIFKNDNKESSDLEVRRASSAMIFQDYTRFEVKVRNFVDPRGRLNDEALKNGLIRSKSWDFVKALPAGVDTMLGPQWDGAGLSGGQWQRLVLARVFLSEAPVWILDEPTSAVDAIAEAAIYHDILNDRPRGTTVIVISHRPQTLKEVDQIFVMDNGKIVENGTYSQLIRANGAFAELARN